MKNIKAFLCALIFSCAAGSFLGALKVKFVAIDGAENKTWAQCKVWYDGNKDGVLFDLAARETRNEIENAKTISRVDFVASDGTTTNWTGPDLNLRGKSWIEFKIKRDGSVYKVKSSKSPDDYTVG